MRTAESVLKEEYFKLFRPSFPSDERTWQVVELSLTIKEETQAIHEAMKAYAREACEEQRIKCCHEYMKIEVHECSDEFKTIQSEYEAIENAPLPELK